MRTAALYCNAVCDWRRDCCVTAPAIASKFPAIAQKMWTSLRARDLITYSRSATTPRSCPIFPETTTTIHHNFEDPTAIHGSEAERLALFCRVRDEIRQYLRDFPRR